MDLDGAVELIQEATTVGLLVAAPVLLVSLVVGLALSLLQAVTQIQEQTLQQIPKLLLMAVTILVLLPWTIQRLVDYATVLFHGIPATI